MPCGEFLGWLGCWFVVKPYPGYHPKGFFSAKYREHFWNPPHLSDAMSGKRFERINAFLKLDDEEEVLEHKDRFF